MRTHLAAMLCLWGLGCVHPPRSAPGEEVPDHVGFFPLPSALSTDPATLTFRPLEIDVVSPERAVLSNGLAVYALADATVPLVTVQVLTRVGSVDEPSAQLGLTDLLFPLLVGGGAGALSADALEELLEGSAVNAGGSGGDEQSSVSMNLRSEDLRRFLPVFSDIVLRPRFEPARVEVARARYLEHIRRRPDNPEGLAARALRKAVYGPTSPWAREPTARTIAALRTEELKTFHREKVVPGLASVMVAGNFDRAEVLALLEAAFGKVARAPTPTRSYPAEPPLARRVILVPKELPQAKLRLGGYGYQRHSPLEYPLKVLNTSLSAFGLGRLSRQIRVRKGLAYSASSGVYPGPTRGFFQVAVDTKVGTVAAALDEALSILTTVGGEKPLEKEEIAAAVDTYLNSFAFRFDSAEKIVREKAIYELHGYPEDYLARFRERISAVTAADASLAASSLEPSSLQIVVVGPRALGAELTRFGPLTVIEDVEAFR